MKNKKHIQTDVGSSSSTDTSDPHQGAYREMEVPAEPSQRESKASKREKRKREEEESQKQISKASISMAVFVLLALIGVSIFWIQQQQRDHDRRSQDDVDSNAVAPSPVEIESLDIEEALQLVEDGMYLKQAEQVASYFSLEGLKPQDALDYLAKLKLPERSEMDLKWTDHIDQGSQANEGVLVRWMADGQIEKRLAPLAPDENGDWKINFSAFACVCIPAWTEFLEGRAEGGTARIVVSHDSYYNGRFQESDWVSYRMTSLGSGIPVYGYARKGTAQHQALEKILGANMSGFRLDVASDRPKRRAIVELQREQGDLSKQYEISRVLAADWVMRKWAYDDAFEE